MNTRNVFAVLGIGCVFFGPVVVTALLCWWFSRRAKSDEWRLNWEYWGLLWTMFGGLLSVVCFMAALAMYFSPPD